MLEGHLQKLMPTRTQEKGAVTPQETDTHECPGVSSGSLGQQWPAAGLEALSAAGLAWDLLKEVTIIFITSTIVWPEVKQKGGNTALPFNRKLD